MSAALPVSTPATRLARAIGKDGRSFATLSLATGIAEKRIGRLARGQSRMMVEDCEQLALALNVSASYLAFGVYP